MMEGSEHSNRVLLPGCMSTKQISRGSSHPGFVMCKKGSHPIGKPLHDDTRVFRKVTSSFAFRPTALFMESQRQVIVIQADIRLDVFGEQRIHETVVKIQSLLINR